ncbi:threonine/homoserine efflux transporter RhtA [Herbihabitans rhizosphaerae]|uniref:Threonine/homoserine efflux transporter RhtA n=1 Tax=Herbihabitans rhizosphaerae TaxID=1872711 RepID=A0A4V2ESU7_9PSEU|nr:DMT family transporter [Herbihabitans rhizosphaerae]RZS38813.1 threonine/homoserine efflux transporter RhtA [Herbihabitans rhizosphaerae]
MGEARTLLRMGALALMWGSSFLWIKLGLEALSPVQLVFGRLLLGSLVLTVLVFAYRDRFPRGRRIWLLLAGAALFHNAMPFLLFAIGEQTVDSGVTGVINSTSALWALLVAWLWRTEKPTTMRTIGFFVGLAGTLLIFAPWQASGLISWGAFALLMASISYGVVFVYEGKYLSATGTSPVVLSAGQMILATGMITLVMPFGGTAPVHLDWTAAIAVIVLGVFSSGFAFVLSYRLLADEGAVAASTVGYLLPVVSVLLGTVFLNEALNVRVIIGMAIVLAGVALTRVTPPRQTPTSPPERITTGVPVESAQPSAGH